MKQKETGRARAGRLLRETLCTNCKYPAVISKLSGRGDGKYVHSCGQCPFPQSAR